MRREVPEVREEGGRERGRDGGMEGWNGQRIVRDVLSVLHNNVRSGVCGAKNIALNITILKRYNI